MLGQRETQRNQKKAGGTETDSAGAMRWVGKVGESVGCAGGVKKQESSRLCLEELSHKLGH